jgi:hypothetical protein
MTTEGRDLYLDLLIKILANIIYEDGSIGPQPAAYRADIRALGRDWPCVAHTMVGLRRLQNLRELVQRTLDENIPGDYIETGVWRGGCCILMRGILAANEDRCRRVYVADSFEGLPPPNAESFPADRDDRHATFAELAVPLEQVRSNFAKYDLLDDRVVFVKGWFKDTLPGLAVERLALMRLDGDMYESTIQALDALYPKLSNAGFVIIDDYILSGCRQAVDDFRSAHGITAPIVRIDQTGVWWQKQ